MVLFATLAVASGVGPAGAHAVFQGVKSVPVDADGKLTMHVPHERDEATYNVKVVVALAAGWRAVDCAQKPTWTCALGESGSSEVITFTKDSGSERSEDETFEFTVHSPPTVGQFSIPTQQTYSDGGAVNWSGAPGSAEPAPILRTVTGDQDAEPADAAAPAPTHAAPAVSSAPGSAALGQPTPGEQGGIVIADPAPVTAEPVSATADQTDSGGSSASVLPAVALVVLLIFGGVTLRRQHARSEP